MKTVSLDGAWTLSYGPQTPDAPLDPDQLAAAHLPCVDAQVPGNVELDLMHAGILPPLHVGNNIYLLREYEGFRWWYRRSFATPQLAANERADLVFEGLDCLGTVFLNGRCVGEARNMLIAHRFDVTEALRPAGEENDLLVRIDSAVLAGRAHCPEAVEGAFVGNWESLAIRKAPHMYGWDIMPRVVSAGLWRGVNLEVLAPTRWEQVHAATIRADAAARRATLNVDWQFATDRFDVDGWEVRVRLSLRGEEVHFSRHPVFGCHARTRVEVASAELWWPRGYGDQPLYELQLELVDEAGTILDTWRGTVGLRTIHLRRTDVTSAQNPGEFVFVVNGERIFAKGTNWVPLDALHSRDPQHLHAAMEMIADLNCNMIRCWGGNVYEDHEFFDYCDRLGVMVWQDFALACAIYPQTDEFADEIRREAEVVVRKLRNHPSLALWAGNNEIDQAFAGWFGTPLDPNTDRLSRQVLPEVVRRLDPYRDYLPSSPYVSPAAQATGDLRGHMPEDHLWGPRDDFKGPFYTQSPAHFVSEIGYHGCPCKESLEEMMEEGFLWPWQDNEQWLTHAVRPLPKMTQYDYRIPLMAKQTAVLFGEAPDNLEDFILASQISQAEAKKFFIEWFRAGKWRRTGILWWNLRDGWPIISDAVVDYLGRKKLAYQYIRRAQADVCAICCEPAGGWHELAVVNDTRESAAGHLTVTDADTGELLLDGDWSVEANGKATVGSVQEASRPAMWLLQWTARGATHSNHYLAGPRPFSLADMRRWLPRLESL
jgi:beta-mannosidase